MSTIRVLQAARFICLSGRFNYNHPRVSTSSRLGFGKYPCRTSRVIPEHANSREIATSVDEFPLSREEALAFVSDTLKVPNFRELMERDRLFLLNTLLNRLKHTVPLTNVTFCQDNSVYKENECLFLERCKNDMLSCRGGQCFWIGGFFNALLEHLQYETTLCSSGDQYSGIFYAHPTIIVHNLEVSGSRHLVECSPTYPIFEAVPLDFDKQSDSFVRFGKMWKFFNAGEGMIKYCNHIRNESDRTMQLSEIIDSEGKQWEVFMDYRTRRNLPQSQFIEIFLMVMTTAIGNMYRRDLFIHGFSGVIGKWVTVQNKILIRDEDGVVLESMAISSDRDLIDRVIEYFPQYTPALIEICLKNLKQL